MKNIEVVAAVIKKDDRIFVTERGYGEFKGLWEFPGGKIEVGETKEEALKRELKEELEIETNIGDFICTVDYDYPSFHLTMHVFYVSICKGEPVLKEHMNSKWIDINGINNYLMGKGDIEFLPADIIVLKKIVKKY